MALRNCIAGKFLLASPTPIRFSQSEVRISLLLIRSCSSNPNESFIARGWRKLAVAIKTFMAGSKALYSDVKKMYEIRSKHGNYVLKKSAPQKIAPEKTDFPFTRQQLHFTINTRKTLVKMLPTVTLFFIPVLGYVVPLVAFMYPNKLLSTHFWTKDQMESFRLLRASQSEALFKDLVDDVRRNTESLKPLDELYTKICEADWKEPILFQSSSKQMDLLCRGWGLRPWLPISSRQHRHLERHMYYLFTCDWLALLEGGVDNLTDNDVIEMCTERKIRYTGTSDVDRLRQELSTWISVTTRFKECPVSMMAHLPMVQYFSPNNNWTS